MYKRQHRHSLELTGIAGKPTAGVIKDVVMLGGFQELEFDFVADNPGPTLFHCHQRPHATNEEFGPPFYKKIVFVSYFNAGIRAFDVRDPYNPQNVAFYIPAITQNTDYRCGPYQGNPNLCRRVIQTNNVATDDRGYIYIVDRADTGLHILQLTGEALEIIAGKN